MDIDQAKQQYSEELSKTIGMIKKCYAEVLDLKLSQINEHTDFILDLGGTSMDYYNLINKISIATGKEVSLVNSKALTTPLDFALHLSKTKNL
ncbi:hypothetical protein FACS1894218_1230 [Bacilli bacterium]|nr:hypothetical protein FACS1894218_1230 [Bacilli bacterium]